MLILVACFLSSTMVTAQKAKFKNKIVTVQKTRLPHNYVAPENRTYDLYTKGTYSTDINPHEKGIFGWTKDEENPKLKGVLSVYGFSMGSAKKATEKKESKDKEGKVTKWNEYNYSATASGKGTLYVYGESNPFKYQKAKKKKKNGKKSKYELKKEAAEAEKKKAIADNPFLSAEDAAEAEESDISTDEGLSDEALTLVNTIKVDQTQTVKTKNYRKSTDAYKEYKNSQRPKLENFRSNYPNGAYKSAISQLNKNYGYAPVNYRFYLKRMKSDKHKEFKKWNDACLATETLFKMVKYNESIDEMQSKFDPIVEYFANMLDKTSDTDKKTKKMKKAAFQNLVDILYYLDRHDEALAYCEKNIESKFIDKSCERKHERSKRHAALLAFHKMTASHVETEGEIAADDIESEEAVEADDETK